MIHVARERVIPPAQWRARSEQELARATAELGGKAALKAGKRLTFQLYRTPETRRLLEELFRGKCAFCESRVDVVSVPDVEHFRPKDRAVGLDGSVMEPGYWWLASSWSNLYLSCQTCNRNKANRFPVVGKPARRPGEEAHEAALILDPCRDDPARYLVFREDGLVAGLPQDAQARKELLLNRFRGHDRAQVTIDLFGLNRTDLVQRRLELATRIRKDFQLAVDLARELEDNPVHEAATRQLEELLSRTLVVDEDGEYVALRRQLAAELRAEALGYGLPLGELATIAPTDVGLVEEKDKRTAFEQLEKHQVRVKASSIEDRGDNLIFRHAATIVRIEIENFRNIEHVEFDFPLGSADRTGWKVLLGENGVGKSSVLQAVALTLMGSRRASVLKDVNKRRLLRDGARPANGYVRVYLSAEVDPLEMQLTRQGLSFRGRGPKLRTFVVGFGAARWLPRPGALPPERDPVMRIRNLFNPFVPLQDARGWLMSLDRRQFARAKGPVLRLLDRPEGDRLRRLRGQVMIHPEDAPLSKAILLDELSDGYQAMLAIAGEISQITAKWWVNPADAEGLVLVDELGAHLHPRWKMRVVESMRRAFPRMQVLASTHDPLCLRGLDAGEILVMRRDEERELVVLDNLPGTAKLRVDQLLTSRLFGLGSTLDPTTERQFSEYYALLGKRTLDDQQQRRLDELRAVVGSNGILGATPRDQAIYRIVDEYLATRPTPTESQWLALSDDTKSRVLDLLRSGDEEPTQ